MPELPEVETVVRDLRRARISGKAIARVHIYRREAIAGPMPDRFGAEVAGRRIYDISRRGKYIVMVLSGGWHLIVHLRMTGQLLLNGQGAPADRHEHLVLEFDNGVKLHFRDSRKFGRWWLVPDPAEVLGKLGPEPLDPAFGFSRFRALVSGRTGLIKPVLLDQTVIAGLGNIYANEALWEARIHPLRACATLSTEELRRLYVAMRRILRRAIRAGGTSLGRGSTHFCRPGGEAGKYQEQLRVHGRAGKACPRQCGSKIQRLIVHQRSSYVCPTCQTFQAGRRCRC
ncbi:MAG: bifunctional DNA-formamidopyrimidine glycosylase/DNA-(apurinic or apyrimidinic site) lyase [Kiritimatiellae bacterium]|nr:bifunctional DNA-formamidopyrimidine glycosylase/DNA-(apurinic or apyrimidinic site) lyase [Kiritimatiellia bacterium]